MSDTALIIIHYEGEDKLKSHKMDLEAFTVSMLAFNNLIYEISSELGIEKDNLLIEISPLDKGGLKATLIVTTIFIGSSIGSHVIGTLWDGLHMNQRLRVETLIQKLNTFLDHKNNPANENKIIKLTNGLDAIDARIMKNPAVHHEAEVFTSVLGSQVDYIGISEDNNSVERKIPKENKKYFLNPFSENEFDKDSDEKIIEEDKILRLEGSHLIGAEWTFSETSKSGKKRQYFRAEVLDPWLVNIGRKKSLSELEDRDISCTIRAKIIKRNQRRTIKKYIIKACFRDETMF